MMGDFLYFYEHIPYHINPVFFSAGFFRVSWYAMMYIVAFGVVYLLLRYRIRRKEIFNFQFSLGNQFPISNDQILKLLTDFLLYSFLGLLIGARLGYVFFYNFSFFWHNPLAIISPFDLMTGKFIGIYGMSYHGGLIGVIIVAVIFCRKNSISFWRWANFVVPAIPLGYFFGRLGNFLSGQLYGRVTTKPWGMYFPGVNQLRHPSQLYEAALEGLILFAVLWPLRNKKIMRENTLATYIIGYAVARMICEFFREPDPQIGILAGYFTMGQLLSFLMLLGGLIIFLRT